MIEEDRATGRREFRFISGPVFTNLLLADEINRTPPKTQAALLQAMQEREVSAGRQTMKLERPVPGHGHAEPARTGRHLSACPKPSSIASCSTPTSIIPATTELAEIVLQTTGQATATVEPILDRADIEQIQGLVRRVPIARPVVDYVVRLSAVTRPVHPQAPRFHQGLR